MKPAGGEFVSKSQTAMAVECPPSGRVLTDDASLPTQKLAVAGGPSQWSAALGYTDAQPGGGSQRRDPPAVPGRDSGFEQRYAAFSVEPRSDGGGLPETSLRHVLEHMQAHLDQALPVTALAAVAQMSPYHFSRRFKQSTGLSPHQYLLLQRIERAKELLAQHRHRVAEVSYELGFPHQSHFTTVFRKLVGVTPRAYQRQRSGK
jgi:AraC-like DNA-binding protein